MNATEAAARAFKFHTWSDERLAAALANYSGWAFIHFRRALADERDRRLAMRVVTVANTRSDQFGPFDFDVVTDVTPVEVVLSCPPRYDELTVYQRPDGVWVVAEAGFIWDEFPFLKQALVSAGNRARFLAEHKFNDMSHCDSE